MVIHPSSMKQLHRREDEVERGDLIGVSTKLEKPNLSDKIPQNNIRILRATCKAHTGIIER